MYKRTLSAWRKIIFVPSSCCYRRNNAQATVSVKIEENDRTTVGQSADTDTLVASANAYLNALNKMLIKREKKSLYKNIEHQKIKGGV